MSLESCAEEGGTRGKILRTRKESHTRNQRGENLVH
jgi:hypothetical protein